MRLKKAVGMMVLALGMGACSTGSDSASLGEINAEEYTPATGAGAYSAEEADGPGPRRLLIATSSDGVTFTRSNDLLSDQANTPNMIVWPNGRIVVYFTGFHLESGTKDGIGAAVSDDQGVTWKYYKVAMNGFSQFHASIGDPDIVRLDDGTYRMYVTNGSSDGTEIQIISTTSTDGFNFAYEGVALDTNSTDYKDSLTQKIGSNYVMFALKSSATQMKRALSTDGGKTFTSQSDSAFTQSSESYVLSNWYDDGSGTFRVFGFSSPTTGQIRSFTTTDGVTFTPDSRVYLARDSANSMEKTFVKDAAVGKLSDGSYLMVYVSEIP
jgi:hypothetical protein